jgi:DNA-binding CsgD family transcriptional regulator
LKQALYFTAGFHTVLAASAFFQHPEERRPHEIKGLLFGSTLIIAMLAVFIIQAAGAFKSGAYAPVLGAITLAASLADCYLYLGKKSTQSEAQNQEASFDFKNPMFRLVLIVMILHYLNGVINGSLLVFDYRADQYSSMALRYALFLFYPLGGWLGEKKPGWFLKYIFPVAALFFVLSSALFLFGTLRPNIFLTWNIIANVFMNTIFGATPFVFLSFSCKPQFYYFLTIANHFCASLTLLASNVTVSLPLNGFLVILFSSGLFLVLMILIHGVNAGKRQTTQDTQKPAGSAERRGTFFAEKGLTKREAEIAELLYQGLSRPVIAKQLFIARITVDTHAASIYRKLGVKTFHEFLRVVES